MRSSYAAGRHLIAGVVQQSPLLMLVFGVILSAASPVHAQTGASLDLPARELVIGTKQAPPFAMKNADGQWEGISIELWERIADQLNLRYRFQETNLQGVIDGVAGGKFDAGVAALTISATREAILDFSQPFYTTGLGIAVPASGTEWWPIIRSMFSLGFIRVVLVLVCVLAGIGLLIWLFERRRNRDFGGGALKGIANGFWWAAVTMTTVGYGDKVPSTVAGRLLSLAWMFASLIVISTFIAGITSALTASRLAGVVHDVSDLHHVRVGAVARTTTTDYLTAHQIAFFDYPDPAAALLALQNNQIDAVVYDRPLLPWLIKQKFAETLQVLPLMFDKQTYGIALPVGSPLREPVDRMLLEIVHSDWWSHLVFRYLNERT